MNAMPHPAVTGKKFVVWIVGLLLIMLFATAVSQQTGDTVSISEPAADDQYLAGRLVNVNAPVDGDVVAAGQELRLQGNITGDIMAAGERIEIAADVGDDIRAAGRIVRILGNVDGHVVAAGETISLSSNSRVTDWAWLAGKRIQVDGNVIGDLRAAGETVVIAGEVTGSVDVMADTVRLEPGAAIGGDLVWRGRKEPIVSQGASVAGSIQHKPAPRNLEPRRSVWGGLFFGLAVALLAAVIGLLCPGFANQVGDIARTRPLVVLGVAILVMFVLPITIILSFVTGIGFLLGMVLLAIFLATVFAGISFGLIAAVRIGAELVGRPIVSRGSLIGALLIAVPMYWVVTMIPVLGGLTTLALWLFGIGTLGVLTYRRMVSQAATETAAHT